MKFQELKQDLEWRGLLKDITNEESFEKIVNEQGKFYIGIDPTADSIHLGHYMSISLIKVLAKHGLKPVVILGGFTGMIGDPSGRNSEREVVDKEVIKANIVSITKQVSDLLNKAGVTDFEIIDNSTFYEEMTIIDLYQNYGKLLNVNTMLSKESVKTRLETGISYTEFSYQMFQAIDFLKLYEKHGVSLQLGGSDQWGNIVAGTDLIKKVHGNDVDVSGITINLLTDENGNKIGKTQGVPMWLDIEKTSAYTIFQYLINQTDQMAAKLLTQLTDISKPELAQALVAHESDPSLRILQNELAQRLIAQIHSMDEWDKAKGLSDVLFSEEYNLIDEEDLDNLKSLPSINNEDKPLIDLVIEQEKLSSKREYREFLDSGSIKLNGKTITAEDFKLTDDFYLGKVAFLSLGKKNKFIIWK